MALFKKPEKSYESIVAPLAQMKDDLLVYMDEQKARIETLIEERIEINKKISTSETEIASSESTAEKLSQLLGHNTQDTDV